MPLSRRVLLTVLVILSSGTVAMAEQIDNPQYASWSKFKPGTSITRKAEVDVNGQKMATETTTTLVEVTPEKAVIENKTSMPGMDMPGQKMDIPAKIEKPAAPPAATDAKATAK